MYDFRNIDYKSWDTLRNYRHLGILFWADYNRIINTHTHTICWISFSQHTHIYSRQKKTEPYQRQHLATNLTNDIRFKHFDFAAGAPYTNTNTIEQQQQQQNYKSSTQNEMWNLKSKRTKWEAADVKKMK